MRIYNDFKDAISEMQRDLVEMGVRVQPATYQDKYVKNNRNFETLELQNYTYAVLNPDPVGIGEIQPYCNVEWNDRVEGIKGQPLNPGNSWKLRPDIWEQFLNKMGKFSYTYPERFSRYRQVQQVIKRINNDPDSRQLYISVWDQADILNIGEEVRVPCTLGYQVQVRHNRLNLTYLQRSCDFATHMKNDIYLAAQLQKYIGHETGYKPGVYTHWIGSLHLFRKDAEGIF